MGCFGCKNYTQNFRPKEILKKNLTVFVGQMNQDF